MILFEEFRLLPMVIVINNVKSNLGSFEDIGRKDFIEKKIFYLDNSRHLSGKNFLVCRYSLDIREIDYSFELECLVPMLCKSRQILFSLLDLSSQ